MLLGVGPVADTLVAAAIGSATMLVVGFIGAGCLPCRWFTTSGPTFCNARIATGRWTAPSPPLPAFFEQLWVFVEPVVASKYWPGHSLLMTPGCLLGAPGLVPLLLSGLTGALIFLLATKHASRSVALVAWVLWLTSVPNLHFGPSYFANVTTGALWLVALSWTGRWYSTRSRVSLVLVSATFGWAAITRPLTALALWVPLLVFMLWHSTSRWRDLLWSSVTPILLLLVIPLWSWQTIGTIRITPYTEYARQYFPFDGPGFSFDDSAPRRELPPEMRRYARQLAGYFERHTVDRLSHIAAERLEALYLQLFAGWRSVRFRCWRWKATEPYLKQERPSVLPSRARSVSSLVYLVFPHPPEWIHYYLEVFPVVFVIAASGFLAALRALAAPRAVGVVLTVVLCLLCGADLARSRQLEAQLAVSCRRTVSRVPIASAACDRFR